ncbi:MAG: NAD(P)H-hydrate dehydratase [Candidatus Roizmanbacteria bacterium]|nr:NAD(P)H-hydrate dehydratase [Candidatus Roizmanbacteria bacterium]
MEQFNKQDLKKLYIPPSDSHKGQNGKVMVIAGSKLFHAAALWSLEAAAHLVDMTYFSSVSENNDIVKQAKEQFRNGIIVPRDKIEDYIQEADSVLIGPGLPRTEGQELHDDDTREMTQRLLKKYPDKKWVIDGGSLQVMEVDWIPKHAILTPHVGEYCTLFDIEKTVFTSLQRQSLLEHVQEKARKYNCIIVLKGPTDIVCSPDRCVEISGGNAGMTKGGTGDVLAGVAVGLYAKNDAFISACAASYFNKKAGEKLFTRHGYWFSTSDLVREIPSIMKETLLD